MCPPVLLNECCCGYIFLSLGGVAILATRAASALGSQSLGRCLSRLGLDLVLATSRAAPLLGSLGRCLSRLGLDLVLATSRAAPLLGCFSRCLSRLGLDLVFAAYWAAPLLGGLDLVFATNRAAPLLGGLGRCLSRLRSMEIIETPCNPRREGGRGEGVGDGSHVGTRLLV
jgi:uncharacterized membrane protein YjjB (DUF3815 family)